MIKGLSYHTNTVMKRKMHVLSLLLLCCSITTGCYPGDAGSGIVSEKSPSVSVPDVTSENEVPDNSFQSSNEKLHITITEDDLSKYSTVTMLSGVKGTVRPWDMEMVNELFGNEVVSEEKIEDVADARNYWMYTLNEDGFLSCYDGGLFYRKSAAVMNRYSSYMRSFDEAITPSLCKKDFPNDELENFPKDDALKVMQEYIDALNIPVQDEPLVYAMDVDSVNKVRDVYLAQGSTEEEYPAWTREDEAYRFVYALQPDGMRVIGSSLTIDADKAPTMNGYLTAIISKSGLMLMDCSNVLELDQANAKEITGCSAEEAFQEVKSGFEQIVLTGDTYMENLYFGYGLQMIDDFTFELVPMWHVGVYNMASVSFENGTSEIPAASSHFVNVETGKEYS